MACLWVTRILWRLWEETGGVVKDLGARLAWERHLQELEASPPFGSRWGDSLWVLVPFKKVSFWGGGAWSVFFFRASRPANLRYLWRKEWDAKIGVSKFKTYIYTYIYRSFIIYIPIVNSRPIYLYLKSTVHSSLGPVCFEAQKPSSTPVTSGEWSFAFRSYTNQEDRQHQWGCYWVVNWDGIWLLWGRLAFHHLGEPENSLWDSLSAPARSWTQCWRHSQALGLGEEELTLKAYGLGLFEPFFCSTCFFGSSY